jgi:hypothetical protein
VARGTVQLHQTFGISFVVALQFCTSTTLAAQAVDAPISLQVGAGRPLEIVIEDRVTVHHVGQPVTGTLVNPLYAYDRIVVPAGTTILGHIVALQDPSTFARTRAMMAGDFTPRRHVVLQFDTLVLGDDRMPISTTVKIEIPHLKRTEAPKSAEEAAHSTGMAGPYYPKTRPSLMTGLASRLGGCSTPSRRRCCWSLSPAG